MMHEHLLMPHPVLRPETSDYASASFEMIDFRARRIQEFLVIEATLALSCATLEHLVSDKNAKFYLIARCSNTQLRCATSPEESQIKFKIPLDDLSGRLVLTPYVIASEPIAGFTSEEHVPEIQSVGGVDIPKGSILAVAASHEVQLDRVGSIKSCIRIVSNSQVPKGTYALEAESEFITIAVDPQIHEDVQKARTHANDIFYPSIYQAAIEYAMREIEEHPDSRWAQALRKTLTERGIEIDDSLAKNAHIHAQTLLEKPLARMVEWNKRRENYD